MPGPGQGLPGMDLETDDLLPRLCCAGCYSCARLLEAAYLRGWLELSAPDATMDPCPSTVTPLSGSA